MPMMRVLQRRFSFQPELSTNDVADREKEAKLVILTVLSEVINEAIKKSTAADQDASA